MFIGLAYDAISKSRKFGSCQCALNTPPECESVVNHISRKSRPFCPFWDTQGFSIECNLTDIPAVPVLDLPSKRPLAICGFVVSVVIQAFNRMLCRWAWPHIVIKHLKRISPSLADFNSSAAIVMVSAVVFILAATNHVTPDTVFRTFGEAVRCVPLGCCDGRQTAAAFCATCNEAIFLYHSRTSTFAYAPPQPPATACEDLGSNEFEHMQFTKNATTQIAV